MGVDEVMEKAGELLEKAQRLPRELKPVFDYFYRNVSVGDLRALSELEKLGVRDPQEKIEALIGMGLLERGHDTYNLAGPLREYIFRRSR